MRRGRTSPRTRRPARGACAAQAHREAGRDRRGRRFQVVFLVGRENWNAVLRHAARNDKVRDPSFPEFLLKRRFEEGIRFPLPDDGLALDRFE